MDYEALLPGLPPGAADQLRALKPLYEEWNAAINVVSRKDMEAFDERHVLHSLAIFRAMPFAPDLGFWTWGLEEVSLASLWQ